MYKAGICFLLWSIFNQSMATATKRNKIFKTVSLARVIERARGYFMVDKESFAKLSLGDTAMLASIFIPLPCSARLPSPVLPIPLMTYSTATPTRIKLSKFEQAEGCAHTLAGAIAHFASYSIRLTIKYLLAYWASKIFTASPFRSWGRSSAFQATILFMGTSAIIRELLATISTNNYSHSYIIRDNLKYVKGRSLA